MHRGTSRRHERPLADDQIWTVCEARRLIPLVPNADTIPAFQSAPDQGPDQKGVPLRCASIFPSLPSLLVTISVFEEFTSTVPLRRHEPGCVGSPPSCVLFNRA